MASRQRRSNLLENRRDDQFHGCLAQVRVPVREFCDEIQSGHGSRTRRTSSRHMASAASPRRWCSSGVSGNRSGGMILAPFRGTVRIDPVTGLSRGASTAVVDFVAPSRLRGTREITSAVTWLSAGRRLLFPVMTAGPSITTGFFRFGGRL
jgi:hypothetical protein